VLERNKKKVLKWISVCNFSKKERQWEETFKDIEGGVFIIAILGKYKVREREMERERETGRERKR
jgi:hypothetical protein